MKKITFSNFVLYISILVLATTNFSLMHWKKEDRVIKHDVVSYYCYLPAFFIYKDITLKFRYNYVGEKKFIVYGKKLDNGNYLIKTSLGPALLYLPFFLPAHFYADYFDYNTGGYSEPYKFALILSALFYFTLGLIATRKILLKFFNDFTSGFVIIAIVFGTNLFWYASFEAAMPHVQSFMLISIFTLYTIKWHDKPLLKHTLILGFSLGLISLIRPTNTIIIFLLLLYNLKKFSELKKHLQFLLKKYFHFLLIFFAVLLIWLPQFLYWKKVTGSWLFWSYGENEQFFFNNPHIIDGLFSYRKGLFLYTPIMIFAFLGIPFLWHKVNANAFGICFFMIINIYIIFSWWSWWYGGSFGQRPMIDSLAVSAICIAAIFDFFHRKRKRMSISFSILFSLLILFGIYHTYLYKTGAIHWDSMTKEAYFDSFGRIHPSKTFKSLIKEPDYYKAQKGIDEYK